MEVLVCIWINFSKHLKKEREREKGWGPPNYYQLPPLGGVSTTRNPLIYDEIHMTFFNFVIDHTGSMTNSQISSQIGSVGSETRYEVQTLWRCANFIIDFVTDHTSSMTTVEFLHGLVVLDMKPDMKSKHYIFSWSINFLKKLSYNVWKELEITTINKLKKSLEKTWEKRMMYGKNRNFF
jgi:hypothetical protein